MKLKESYFARFFRHNAKTAMWAKTRRARCHGPRPFDSYHIEPLEPRILLSADPLIFDADPNLAVELSLSVVDDNGTPTIQITNENGVQGAEVVASRAVSTTSKVLITGSNQDDVLSIDDFDSSLFTWSFNAGLGSDSLYGSDIDNTWSITGMDAGTLNGQSFSGVEHLYGGVDNEDTFTFEQGGSLSGVVEGGDGGFDSVELAGDYLSVDYVATGADSGIIGIDGIDLVFSGMEPINFVGNVGTYTFSGANGTLLDSITLSHGGAAGAISIDSTFNTGSAEVVNLTSAQTLIIDGGAGPDEVTLTGELDFGGGSLEIFAESITVAADADLINLNNLTLHAISSDSVGGDGIGLDIDGNGDAAALTDGLLMVRYLDGLRGNDLIQGVVDPTGLRTTAQDIEAFLASAETVFLDVDDNSAVDSNDAGMILRYLFGLRGDPLINGLIDPTGGRPTAGDVETYLAGFLPGSVSNPGSTSAISLTASVLIDGDITATGDVSISAVVNNTVNLSEDAPGTVSVGATSSATAIINGDVTAGTLSLTAETNTDISVEVNNATFDDIEIGATTPLSQTTHAGIGGGATIIVGTGAIASEPDGASVLIQAVDTTDIQTTITTGTLAAITGIDFVSSQIDLIRDTQAYFGDTVNGQATLSGANNTDTGLVKIIAENVDGTNGGVGGTITSNFLDEHANTITDNVLAFVEDADLDVHGLIVETNNAATYFATSKLSSNDVTGETKAYVNASNVSASTPLTVDQGVEVRATDSSSYSTSAGDQQVFDIFDTATFNLLDAALTEIGKASATNEINKTTNAYVEASTVGVTDGDMRVEAMSDMIVSAEASSMAFLNTGSVVNVPNKAAGGTFTFNEILGDTEAYILSSTVTADEAEGDVVVDAKNTTKVDATAEATNEAIGGTNATVGGAVAFNSIGWDISNPGAATLEALIGSDDAFDLIVEEDGGAEAKAYIQNSTVIVGKDVSVNAETAQQLNATVSNVSKSTAEALFNANGVSVGGIVASNRVSSAARAFITEDVTDPKQMTAGGQVTVGAEDNSGIFANSKIITSQITTNNGGIGVLNDGAASLIPIFGASTYSTSDLDPSNSTQTLNFGDTVSLAINFDSDLGEPGRTYQYMGTGDTIDLLTEDYNNLDIWKELVVTQISNDGMNLTNSNSVGLGGMVVRNQVKGAAEADIENAHVDAASVTVEAIEAAILRATADATAESSGGSAFGKGESIAFQGVIAVNVVLSRADAHISGSEITTTTGDVIVNAENTSSLGAENNSYVNSGAQAVSIVLAFNTIGFDAQNLLFDTFDALVGLSPTSFDHDLSDPNFTDPETLVENDRVKDTNGQIFRYTGPDLDQANGDVIDLQNEVFIPSLDWVAVTPAFENETPAEVIAYVEDSVLDVDGDLTVTADALTQLEARTSNNTSSAAAALFGASAMSAAGILASNKVSSSARAFIDYDDSNPQGQVDVTGQITVDAKDDASLNSTTNMVAASSKQNDLGLGVVNDVFNTLVGDYAYTTNSGTQNLEFGDQVRLDDVDHTTGLPPTSVAQGDWVQLSSDIGGGTEGQIYEYLSTDPLPTSGPLNTVDFSSVDFTSGDWREIQGNAGTVYEYMGTAATGIGTNLATTDYTDFEFWKELSENSLIPASVTDGVLKNNKLDPGKAKSFYGMVARNDLVSEVEAYIENASVRDVGTTTGGPTEVSVSANESVTMIAVDNSVISSPTTAGGGAGGGVLVNNQLRSSSDAYIRNSDVRTADGSVGDVLVHSMNDSQMDATTLASSDGGDFSVGIIAAFNSIGFEAGNVLFQAIDAILGEDLLVGEETARAHAFIEDSTVEADGDIRVTADSSAMLHATSGNEQNATPTNSFLINKKFGGEKANATGGMLASNKVSSEAKASIDYTLNYAGAKIMNAGGTVEVSSKDEASIEADSSVIVVAVNTNNLSALYDVAEALGAYDYDFTTASGSQVLIPGASSPFGEGTRVRLADDYTFGGDGGAIYEYLGGLGVDPVDLGTQDYENGPWQKITLGKDDTNFFDTAGNLSASPARAFAGLIVLNDVRADSEARIEDSVVNAGEVLVTSLENSSIIANSQSNVTASGGSIKKSFGSGDVITFNVHLATNYVQGNADAFIKNSTVTTSNADGQTGNVSVDAQNTAGLDATINTSVDSGEVAIGVTFAFNTLGWGAQNVLFQALDTIAGDSLFADEVATEIHDESLATGARASAYIEDTTLDAAGDVSVTADNAARLNATVSNVADSAASAFFDASGKAFGFLLSMNKVASSAEAYVDNDGAAVIPATSQNLRAVGTLTVSAEDNSEFYANVKMVSSSITTNDGGVSVITGIVDDVIPADFSTDETNVDIKFGERVRLSADYANGGNGGSVYQFMGTDADGVGLDLSVQDYSDAGFWKEVLETQLFPEGVNQDNSDSNAIGGLIVYNDLRTDTEARIVNTNLVAGDVDIDAIENAIIKATTESSVTSSGGSAFTGQGDSLALNGLIATNALQSEATAFILDSTVLTTIGDVDINAENTSILDAKTLSSTSTGAQGVGVTLAFNSVGYKTQNILFNTLDTLIGGEPDFSTLFDRTNPASVQAYIEDSSVDSAGAINLSAVSESEINATLTNETDSAAYSFGKKDPKTGEEGASGFAVGAVLASNLVNSEARAFINSTTGSNLDIHARGGGVNVFAQDDAGIVANTKLTAASSTTNDGGLTLLTNFADTLLTEYQYTDRSGPQDLRFGEQVRIDDVDFNSHGIHALADVVTGSRVQIDFDLANGTASAGEVYEYIGTGTLTVPLDQQDYTDFTKWKLVTATPGGVYQFIAGFNPTVLADFFVSGTDLITQISSGDRVQVDQAVTNGSANLNDIFQYVGSTPLTDAGGIDLDAQDFSDESLWQKINDGAILESNVDLNTEDFTDTSRWREVSTIDLRELIPGVSFNISDSDSAAFGGLVVRNDVRSDVEASIDQANVSAYGDVDLQALETAGIFAIDQSSVTSSGGSTFGGGNSIAVGGVIATNLVLSDANAFITNSTIDTENVDHDLANLTNPSTLDPGERVRVNDSEIYEYVGPALDTANGDTIALENEDYTDVARWLRVTDSILLDAQNTSTVRATIDSEIASNGVSIGVILAFNTIGIQPQNFLFSTVDAIIGTNIANEDPAGARAFIEDSVILSSGGMSATTMSEADIDATVINAASSITATIGDGDDDTGVITVGVVVALNKVSTEVFSYIDNTNATSSIVRSGSGDVTITAMDTTGIDADVEASALGVAVDLGSNKTRSITVGVSIARNEIRNDMEAFISNVGDATNPLLLADGNLLIQTDQSATIDSTSTASAIGVAVSLNQDSLSFSAGGASAINVILGNANAYIDSSMVVAEGAGKGDVTVETEYSSTIDSEVKATAVSVSVGGQKAAAFAIGFSFAENFIGWTSTTTKETNEVLAYIQDSDVLADGNLSISATSNNDIESIIRATTVAVAVANQNTGALSAGGLVSQNYIASDVQAYIDGSDDVLVNGTEGIAIQAIDSSKIFSDAQAVSVAGALSGKNAGTLSFGLSLAFNEIANNVEAFINDAASVETTNGSISINADVLDDQSDFQSVYDDSQTVALTIGDTVRSGSNVYRFLGEAYNYTTESTAPLITDVALDQVVRINDNLFYRANGDFTQLDLGIEDFTNTTNWDELTTEPATVDFNLDSISLDVTAGQIVKLSDTYEGGGEPGRFYQAVTDLAGIDLSTQDYSNTTNWTLVETVLSSEDFSDRTRWLQETSIASQSIAASVAASFSAKNSLAISGGGATSTNAIQTKNNAYITNSVITSAADVGVGAQNSASVDATVVAASAALAFSGKNAIGASIGVAVAENLIGYEADRTLNQAEVQAYSSNSSITAANDLNMSATATEEINAFVFAGSVAVSGSGSNSGGLSGAGVSAENQISTKVQAYIDGDMGQGISAENVSLTADDTSIIDVTAAGASLAGAFAGSNALSLSIGVSLAQNHIDNDVAAYINNADVDAIGRRYNGGGV